MCPLQGIINIYNKPHLQIKCYNLEYTVMYYYQYKTCVVHTQQLTDENEATDDRLSISFISLPSFSSLSLSLSHTLPPPSLLSLSPFCVQFIIQDIELFCDFLLIFGTSRSLTPAVAIKPASTNDQIILFLETYALVYHFCSAF